MKTLVHIAVMLLFTGYASAQTRTGINNTVPTNTLDVNGDLRVRSVATVATAGTSGILLADGSGVVSQISTPNFVNALKIPTNIFNAEQTASIATSLPPSPTSNRVVLGTININIPGSGTWNATNNTYTVAKAGIYHIVSGVRLENTDQNQSYSIYVSAGTVIWAFGGTALFGGIRQLSGTYVKLLAAGDVIYCDTQASATAPNYTQGIAFLHIIYTPL